MTNPELPKPDQKAAISCRPPHETEADAILYCPLCSTRLVERKCKLICEKCGYYLSCSDYY